MVDLDVSDAFRQRAKMLMRRRFASHRKGLPPAGARARSEAIVGRLAEAFAAMEAPRVASFWPMLPRKEVDLRPLHELVANAGGRVAYPRIDASRTMRFHWVDDPEAMVEADMGYLEPTEAHPLAEALDVVLVPGLAFDLRGFRIGYGGGFYDRTLPEYCPPARAWGVCYDLQLAADIPNVGHDVAVDRVVTDRRVVEVTKG